MRSIIIKITLLVLVLFTVKVPALGQNTDIRCELDGLDFNLSGDDPGHLINFGSFSVFADGEKAKGEKGRAVVAKFYKLPRTKLILSIFILHYPKDEVSLGPQLSMSMILGRKRVLVPSSNLDEERMLKDAVGIANTWYPLKAFDDGFEGSLSTAFLGKKKPAAITMTCKKEGS